MAEIVKYKGVKFIWEKDDYYICTENNGLYRKDAGIITVNNTDKVSYYLVPSYMLDDFLRGLMLINPKDVGLDLCDEQKEIRKRISAITGAELL